MAPHVRLSRRSVGWLVGQLICHDFLKGLELTLLSEHLLLLFVFLTQGDHITLSVRPFVRLCASPNFHPTVWYDLLFSKYFTISQYQVCLHHSFFMQRHQDIAPACPSLFKDIYVDICVSLFFLVLGRLAITKRISILTQRL